MLCAGWPGKWEGNKTVFETLTYSSFRLSLLTEPPSGGKLGEENAR
jgi:hypothetical protein